MTSRSRTGEGDRGLRRPALGHGLLWLAAGAGLLHAAFSFFWAVGGVWLLATVGQWAVRAAAEGGAAVRVALAAIGMVKLVAALLPALAEHGAGARARRWIRTVSWPGAIVLVAYGGANTIVAAAVLGGIVRPAGGYDPAAMVGHALLWDPLFLLWGLALASGLALTRLPVA